MADILFHKQIWDSAPHNGFTDLVFYHDRFLCFFREGEHHAGGKDGKIRVLSSADAKSWDPIAILDYPGIDLRDPTVSIMPDGRLMLTLGASVYEGDHCIRRTPAVAFSTDGIKYSPIKLLPYDGEWIWRVSWFNGTGYAGSYSEMSQNCWKLKLASTTDGKTYKDVHHFNVEKYPSEVTLRFQSDGTMMGLFRRRGPGLIGTSVPPYTSWSWFEIGERLGGPNFLIIPNGSIWAASRRLVMKSGDDFDESTILARMTTQSYEPILTLPSGGDSSYPGMVYREGKLYISYYSSHTTKATIWLAIISLTD